MCKTAIYLFNDNAKAKYPQQVTDNAVKCTQHLWKWNHSSSQDVSQLAEYFQIFCSYYRLITNPWTEISFEVSLEQLVRFVFLFKLGPGKPCKDFIKIYFCHLSILYIALRVANLLLLRTAINFTRQVGKSIFKSSIYILNNLYHWKEWESLFE